MIVENWAEPTFEALRSSWVSFLEFIPKLVGALLVFIIGWFVAVGIGKLVTEILMRLKFNKIFENTGWKDALAKADILVDPAEFVGAIFRWILIIIFLMPAVEILGLPLFVAFIAKLIGWIPNLIAAVFILVVAVILADILAKIVKATIARIGARYAEFLGDALRWAIYIIAFLGILLQFEILNAIIVPFIQGFIIMFALAFGLAFGLGGKDAAARVIEDIRKKVSEK